MATHYVTIHLTGSYNVEVEATSIEDAKNKALEAFFDADFGQADEVDGEVFCIEDGNGKRLFEEE